MSLVKIILLVFFIIIDVKWKLAISCVDCEQNKLSENSKHLIRHHHGAFQSSDGKIHRGFYKRLLEDKKFATRCKRYANYVKTYNPSPTYIMPYKPFLLPYQPYQPPPPPQPYYRCQSYCVSCPMISCRQKCPNKKNDSIIKCNCHPKGSKHLQCQSDGHCICKENYTGRTCNQCKAGFWMNDRGECIPCNCDIGAKDNNCGPNGKCNCQDGVGGETCNQCLDNHYGYIVNGCKKCETCRKGQTCDKIDGKCKCPPFTTGQHCEKCLPNAWGYEPGIGCKPCNCSSKGSVLQICEDGICTCKPGYFGRNCDRCSPGYFGYPNCYPCSCNENGSIKDSSDIFGCDGNGQCKCKENVEGSKCSKCKPGTFGLWKGHPSGCIKCYCFGRSNTCEEAVLFPRKNVISIDKLDDLNHICKPYDHKYRYCIKIPLTSVPYYPNLLRSYNGYVSIDSTQSTDSVIYITGNKIRLRSNETKPVFQLLETNFHVQKDPKRFCKYKSRECLMAVLQNVTELMVAFTHKIPIDGVAIDVAEDTSSTSAMVSSTKSIEKCKCPPQYTSSSCEDPNVGHYRKYADVSQNKVDEVIGYAAPCECNGKSKSCDAVTGICKNCLDHTEGDHCEKCSGGYYKDGNDCKSCLCPSAAENNADSCEPHGKTYKCHCKEGYIGDRCDQCNIRNGYYKNYLTNKCDPCNCNEFGSENLKCDESGKCSCKPGYAGEKCNKCLSDRKYIDETGQCKDCDTCAQILFTQMDDLGYLIGNNSELFKNSLQPPWKKISNLYAKYKLLNKEFSEKIEKAERITGNNNLVDLEKMVIDINKSLSILAPGNVTTNIKDIQNRVQYLYTELEKLHNRLRSITKNIQNSVGQQPDLKGALTSAKEILKYIENISRYILSVNLDPKIKSCQNLDNTIQTIYNKEVKIDDVKTPIKDLVENINLIDNASNKLDNRNKKLHRLNDENTRNLKKLKDKIERINSHHKTVKNDMKEIIDKLNATHNLTEKMVEIHGLLSNTNLDEAITKLENLSEEYDNKLLENDFPQKVFKHVKDLTNTLESYKKQFQYNADDLRKINASGAYKNIVKNIKEAKQNAFKSRELLASIYNKISPNDSDSVNTKSLLSKAASDRILKRMKNLPNQEETLLIMQSDLYDAKAKLHESGNDNNKINQKIQNLKHRIKHFEPTLADVVRSLNNDNITTLQRQLNNFNQTHQHSFKKSLEKYFELKKVIDNGEYQRNISMILNNLPSINVSNFTQVMDILKMRNQTVSNINDLISEIKGKINLAKDLANELKYPLSLNNCSRKYEMPRHLNELKKLEINFVCNSGKIFSINDNNNNDNIQVYAENGKIFIKRNNDSKKKISDSANNNLKFGIDKDEINIKTKNAESNKEHVQRIPIKLKNDHNLQFILGDINNNDSADCNVAYFAINAKRIGLWNFIESNGQCNTSISNGGTEIKFDENFFDEFSYQVYNNLTEKRPKQWNLNIDFATFDENSLIFLAFYKQESSITYVSMYLKQGFIYCDLKFADGSSTSLKSETKYNDGELHNLEISFKFDKNILTSYLKIDTFDRTDIKHNFSIKDLFKIRQATIYVGQTDPSFHKIDLPIKFDGFKGYIMTHFGGKQPKISYNVEHRNFTQEKLSYPNAWIRKKGYLIFGSDSKIESISFILESDHATDFPHIQLKTSKTTYSFSNQIKHSNYHVNITDDKITINNKTYTLNKKKNEDILNNFKWEVTIGNNNSEFIGHLKNIFTNQEQFYLNKQTVINFNNIDMGRNRIKRNDAIHTTLKMLVTPETNSMQNTEGCAPVNQYATDEGAVKFGDKPNSFLKLESQFWKRRYTLKFDLRTFYPNGLIVISLNKQGNSYYNSLQLEKGKIQLYIKGKKKKTLFSETINDGNWHTIEITNNQLNLNKKNKLTVILDNNDKNHVSIPKNFIRGDVFIGDAPPTFNSIIKLRHNLYPFIGCMRSLEINEDQVELSTGQNLGRCFPNVEQGAYFAGNSYAIYKNDFQINYNLELSFQFKTAEQNGILLYIFDNKNSPAFSVELQNGAVVMTVDMGNGKSKVTNNLGSEFALCNNKWHNVTALYSNSELTVNIDGITKTWVQSDVNSLLDEVNAPLYIGGVPDDNTNSPRTNKKNNFKGCIRKLKVENTIKDWTDMHELHNILLNSCPIL